MSEKRKSPLTNIEMNNGFANEVELASPEDFNEVNSPHIDSEEHHEIDKVMKDLVSKDNLILGNQFLSLPVRTSTNFSGSDVFSSHSLEDIQEEGGNDNLGFVNNEFFRNNDAKFDVENMSISNFKKIIPGYEDSKNDQSSGIPTSPLHRSFDIKNEQRVSFRRKFKKSASFLITPTSVDSDKQNSNCSETLNNDLKIKVLGDMNIPKLFIEFDTLEINPQTGGFYWMEKSRWLLFEEDYDTDLKRFNSPHLSPMSVRGLMDFKKLFKKGDVILNCGSLKYSDVLKSFTNSMIKTGQFSVAEITDVCNALISKHIHAGDNIVRSASVSAIMKYFPDENMFEEVNNGLKRNTTYHDRLHRNTSRHRLDDKLDPGTEALSVQVGTLERLNSICAVFFRLDSPIIATGLNESNCPIRFIFIVFGPKDQEEKLVEAGRACSILMSNADFRSVVYSAVDRQEIIDAMMSFMDHAVMVPLSKCITAESLAAMLPQIKYYAHLFSTEQSKLAFKSLMNEMSNRDEQILINSYVHGVPKKITINAKNLSSAHLSDSENQPNVFGNVAPPDVKAEPRKIKVRNFCQQLIPPFHLLCRDIKGMGIRYGSDFRDAFKAENAPVVFLGIFFIYFVVLSPAITFGALYDRTVSHKMSVSMCLLASGGSQLFYMFVSGQPLQVIGITAPVFIVEQVLSMLSNSLMVPLEVFRFWIGIYAASLGIIYIAFNGSLIMKHFRRSVEEVYNCFVGMVYLLSALFSMFKALPYNPPNFNTTDTTVIQSQLYQYGQGGVTLFLAFIMVNFCLILVQIKRGSFFRRQIRNCLGCLNVPLGIILIVALNRIFFSQYNLPTLNIPPINKINVSSWVNIPSFSAVIQASPASHGYCFLIGISMFFIFLTEVSTNAICAVKTERRLVKPSLCTLDFFCILVFFPLLSGFIGWPYISGALVRTSAHCIAMSKWSIAKPGEPTRIIGTAEQRVSGIVAGLLTMLSVFLGSILQYIPLAAMYGMFLYMGVMGIRDLVGFQRLVNLFQRKKHWDQVDYLKDIPTFNMAVLVFLQFFFLASICILYALSQFTPYPWTLILFPALVGVFAAIRGYILPLWPRMNTHLSRMDKKHKVKLYEGKSLSQKIIMTVANENVDMKVITSGDLFSEGSDDEDSTHESEIKKEIF